MRLRGLSFHSVKGGVGKSTLAVVAAFQCARQHPSHSVYLIDMDLTGTSLADVLGVHAPVWSDSPAIDAALLSKRKPDGFDLLPGDSRRRVDDRNAELESDRLRAPDDLHVPFLNDFLLYHPLDANPESQVPPEAISWQLDPSLPNLHVIPSSALPGDLDRIIPVIFDEQHAAFLEARLEALISALLERHKNESGITVIVDAPPTVPGLSRSVMSMGLRLSLDEKQPLAANGDVPQPIQQAEVDWTIHLVTSPDPQDLRATERWCGLITSKERPRFRLVVNRHEWSPDEFRNELARAVSPDPNAPERSDLGNLIAFVDSALPVSRSSGLEFFRERKSPDEKTELEFGVLK